MFSPYEMARRGDISSAFHETASKQTSESARFREQLQFSSVFSYSCLLKKRRNESRCAFTLWGFLLMFQGIQ